MPQIEAPAPPKSDDVFVDRATGQLTPRGIAVLDQLWRQVVAGHVNIPVVVSSSSNLYTLTPRMHEEGARAYGDHMVFIGAADAGSTGSVTARVRSANQQKVLSTVKVYKDGGSTQAGNTDIVAGRLYMWIYSSALDGGAGGFVLK